MFLHANKRFGSYSTLPGYTFFWRVFTFLALIPYESKTEIFWDFSELRVYFCFFVTCFASVFLLILPGNIKLVKITTDFDLLIIKFKWTTEDDNFVLIKLLKQLREFEFGILSVFHLRGLGNRNLSLRCLSKWPHVIFHATISSQTSQYDITDRSFSSVHIKFLSSHLHLTNALIFLSI